MLICARPQQVTTSLDLSAQRWTLLDRRHVVLVKAAGVTSGLAGSRSVAGQVSWRNVEALWWTLDGGRFVRPLVLTEAGSDVL